MKNIILIGFMGTGKSSVAKALSEKYFLNTMDTDVYIERKQKMSINDIFKSLGEGGFRDMETSLIRDELPCLRDTVISTGGGMPLLKINRMLLKKAGVVFLLEASADELFTRLKDDSSRPLLACDDPKARIIELLTIRKPIYEDASDYIIRTEGKTPYQIADEIMEIMMREEDHEQSV